MALLYERTETDERILIKFRFFGLKYFLLLLAILTWISLSYLRDVCCSTIIAFPFLGLIGIYYILLWKPLAEWTAALMDGRAKVTGSKIFPWNPLIVEISKPTSSQNNEGKQQVS